MDTQGTDHCTTAAQVLGGLLLQAGRLLEPAVPPTLRVQFVSLCLQHVAALQPPTASTADGLSTCLHYLSSLAHTAGCKYTVDTTSRQDHGQQLHFNPRVLVAAPQSQSCPAGCSISCQRSLTSRTYFCCADSILLACSAWLARVAGSMRPTSCCMRCISADDMFCIICICRCISPGSMLPMVLIIACICADQQQQKHGQC